MQRVLGIDLGTTNSVMAWVRFGQPTIVENKRRLESTPSVLGLGRGGELLVGEKARSREKVDPSNVIRSVKRFMGRQFDSTDVTEASARLPYSVAPGPDGDVAISFAGRTYSPTELSSLILRRMKEEAEESAGHEFSRAVITVPAYFTERQIAATREAGRMAGFQVLRVLDEPTAAALAYAYQREEPEDATLLVFDLGGGTFDISVLLVVEGVFTVLNIEGDNFLGGDDFDALLAERVAQEFRAQHSELGPADWITVRTDAERSKIDLSTEPDTELSLNDLGSPRTTVDLDLAREDFEEMIKPMVDRAMELVTEALRVADVDRTSIDQVLLVGGSTAIPYVQERLGEMFGTERLRTGVHPMKSVALGAAIQGGLISEVRCDHCDTPAPVDAETCGACDHSLRPPPRTTCPHCFLATEDSSATCQKCGGSLDGTVPPAPRPAPAQTTDEDLADPGGLRCSCGTINLPGATTCRTCDRALVEPVLEITSQDRGIELHDGTMAVVLPKGTPTPTPVDQPVSRDFATAVADQRRLEIVVYEGGSQIAQRNALTGYITIPLPAGLPSNSPINVAFGLDADKVLTVSVRVRALGGEPHEIKIQHERRLGPDDLRRIEEQRLALTHFVDKWSGELSAAEAHVFYDVVAELEGAMTGKSVERAQAEEIMQRAERLLATVTRIRGFDAILSAYTVGASKYLDPADRDELSQLAEEIGQARERADWGAAAVLVKQGEERLSALPTEIHDLVYCRRLANQGSLSAALSHRIGTTVVAYDQAFDRDDRVGRRGAAVGLAELMEEAHTELDQSRIGPEAVTKPKQYDR